MVGMVGKVVKLGKADRDHSLGASAGTLRPGIKRSFDIAVALVVLMFVAVPLLLIAIAIKLDSRGPVFYRVRRAGHRGRPLMMVKFRKMRDDANGLPLTAEDDPRLTRVGRVLTRTRIDEIGARCSVAGTPCQYWPFRNAGRLAIVVRRSGGCWMKSPRFCVGESGLPCSA